MAFEKNRVRAAVLALPLAVGLSLGAATAAKAAEDAPQEDPRATIHSGNAKTCDDVGLAGTVIVQIDGEHDFGTGLIDYDGGKLDVDKYLDILSIEDGVEVTGIVVKGGEDANVYVPGEKGLSATPPWKDLRSPLNSGGNIPQISHWYICGSYTPPTTTTTTTTSETTTTTTAPSETSTTSQETTSSTPEETSTTETSDVTTTSAVDTTTDATTTTEAPVVDNASDSDDLAVTGFGSSWLIWAGVLFVVAGVGAITGLRVLRKQ